MANEVKFGTTNVASAGTAIQLQSSTDKTRKVKVITLSAPGANTGNIYFGDSAVSSTNCLEIIKGNDPYRHVFKRPISADTFYADAGTNGDDLGWLIEYAGRGG
jgi:hypothetical protein